MRQPLAPEHQYKSQASAIPILKRLSKHVGKGIFLPDQLGFVEVPGKSVRSTWLDLDCEAA